jgi:Predicted membrane protein
MRNTAERNGVLIFLVPSRRRFAVLGDTGIHEKVGQEFWEAVAEVHVRKVPQGRFHHRPRARHRGDRPPAEGHFPHRPDDVDELPDEVDFGE